ncbi:hypothetical protein LL946_05100 [Knoellia locipacati]|uniref:hypothetical protein n=1 Tax=Knoellia locipacati TaxID=882824 RepID=UPI00384DBBAB
MPSHLHRCRMPARSLVGSVAVTLLLTGCGARGSVEEDRVGDTATEFLAGVAFAPEAGCDLLAPATLEELESDGEECAEVLSEAADVRGTARPSRPGEVRIDVFGRDAMVRWVDQTLFLARFDDGWRVTAAGCQPRGKDLPYDCAVEGR